MRVSLLLFPLLALGVAGCVNVHEHPAPREATIVSPAPPPTVYAEPGTTATVVTRP